MKDRLAAKRKVLADLLNRHRDTDYYSSESREILSLPEIELNRLIEYYDSPRYCW